MLSYMCIVVAVVVVVVIILWSNITLQIQHHYIVSYRSVGHVAMDMSITRVVLLSESSVTRPVPVYSVLEGVEEVVDSFSQSFSPLRLPADGQDEKPSAESGLEITTYMNKQMPHTNIIHHDKIQEQKHKNTYKIWKHTTTVYNTCMHTYTHTHGYNTQRDTAKQGQTPWHNSPNPACSLALHHTVYHGSHHCVSDRGTERPVQPSKAKQCPGPVIRTGSYEQRQAAVVLEATTSTVAISIEQPALRGNSHTVAWELQQIQRDSEQGS